MLRREGKYRKKLLNIGLAERNYLTDAFPRRDSWGTGQAGVKRGETSRLRPRRFLPPKRGGSQALQRPGEGWRRALVLALELWGTSPLWRRPLGGEIGQCFRCSGPDLLHPVFLLLLSLLLKNKIKTKQNKMLLGLVSVSLPGEKGRSQGRKVKPGENEEVLQVLPPHPEVL
jgi:hypothetical protein